MAAFSRGFGMAIRCSSYNWPRSANATCSWSSTRARSSSPSITATIPPCSCASPRCHRRCSAMCCGSPGATWSSSPRRGRGRHARLRRRSVERELRDLRRVASFWKPSPPSTLFSEARRMRSQLALSAALAICLTAVRQIASAALSASWDRMRLASLNKVEGGDGFQKLATRRKSRSSRSTLRLRSLACLPRPRRGELDHVAPGLPQHIAEQRRWHLGEAHEHGGIVAVMLGEEERARVELHEHVAFADRGQLYDEHRIAIPKPRW